jgi:phosphoglucosamine mutase
MSLYELSQGMGKFPQNLINIRFEKGVAPLESEAVKQSVIDAEEAMGDKGRVLLRKSGTEPLIRVMVEAHDAGDSNKWAKHIADTVRSVMN